MTIKERLTAISKRQEIVGEHINNIAILVSDLTESTVRTGNAIESLLWITRAHKA